MHLVDLAEESPRTIVSGLAPYMAMDSLMVTMVVGVDDTCKMPY